MAEKLRWRMGQLPGEDRGNMYCLDCGGEVYGFEEGLICSKCNREEDSEPTDPNRISSEPADEEGESAV